MRSAGAKAIAIIVVIACNRETPAPGATGGSPPIPEVAPPAPAPPPIPEVAPPAPAPPPIPEVAPPAPPPALDAALAKTCDALPRAACLASTACTLDHVSGSTYRCRAATGACERGLVQDDQRACSARAACEWTPAECYCACLGSGRTVTVAEQEPTDEGCGCACGGGPPASCVERAAR